MSNVYISTYTAPWVHDIYSAMSHDDFCKELDLLCKARDLYLDNDVDSLVLEFITSVYTIMMDVLVEQTLQRKDAE